MKNILLPAALAIALISSIAGATDSSPPTHQLFGLSRTRTARPAGLPRKWDKRIPLPQGIAVKTVKPPVGAAQMVEFSGVSDYDKTVAFYKESLPKAGFQLGSEIKVPERKIYNVNFTRAGVQDTLSIFPDHADPAKLTMRIVYTPKKGWLRTKLAKWEDRARILPKWWHHREEAKQAQKTGQQPAAQPTKSAE